MPSYRIWHLSPSNDVCQTCCSAKNEEEALLRFGRAFPYNEAVKIHLACDEGGHIVGRAACRQRIKERMKCQG